MVSNRYVIMINNLICFELISMVYIINSLNAWVLRIALYIKISFARGPSLGKADVVLILVLFILKVNKLSLCWVHGLKKAIALHL